jgi:formylglycine-generating enzyme required for sulfatase activity
MRTIRSTIRQLLVFLPRFLLATKNTTTHKKRNIFSCLFVFFVAIKSVLVAALPRCVLGVLMFAALAAGAAEKPFDPFLIKLSELNRGFDGKCSHKIEAGAVTELTLSTDGVTDLTPIGMLPWLKKLTLTPWTADRKGVLSDLSALKGLPLKSLYCLNNPVKDLSPLSGMPLSELSIGGTLVSDLSPLEGMKLTVLGCNDTAVGDLKPLEGMPLKVFWCQNTRVNDLSPLKGAPLQELRCDAAVGAQNIAVLREIKTLTKINDLMAIAFFNTASPGKPVVAPKATVSAPTQVSGLKEMAIDLGDGVKMEFILIPNGSFMMGSDKLDNAKPAHRVTITKSFYFGKFEVTQEQWEKVMGNNPSKFKGAKNPVEQVSWEDCQKFLEALKEKVPSQTFRLPTEAEWEYACRARSKTEYSYGDSPDKLGDYAWFKDNSQEQTHPVGQKKPNPWDLYDMHGNVREWCQDWHGEYSAKSATDPTGPATGSNRVLRGGSWERNAMCSRSAFRFNYVASLRYSDFGLRVVMLAR